MLEKLKEHDIIDPKTDKVIGKIGCDLREIMDKLNELVDVVNELQHDNSEKANCQENVQQISYIAPGNMTLFHGAGCSVEFDTPLPKGTRITIKSITKGGGNE